MKNVALSKEEWKDAAESLMKAADPLGTVLEKINHEGQGEQDKEEFLAHMQMAYSAMNYVAEFAADKCRFLLANTEKGDLS